MASSLTASDLVQFVLLFVLVHLLLNCNDLLHFRQALPSLATSTPNTTPTEDSVDDQRRQFTENSRDRLPRVNEDNERDQPSESLDICTTVADCATTNPTSAKCDFNGHFVPSESVDDLCDLPAAPTGVPVVAQHAQVSRLFCHDAVYKLHRSSVTSHGPCSSDFRKVCFYLDTNQHIGTTHSNNTTANSAKMVDIYMNNNGAMHGQPQTNADGYMEQEEEWEREGLLDPAWEKQQRKVRLPFVFGLLC